MAPTLHAIKVLCALAALRLYYSEIVVASLLDALHCNVGI